MDGRDDEHHDEALNYRMGPVVSLGQSEEAGRCDDNQRVDDQSCRLHPQKIATKTVRDVLLEQNVEAPTITSFGLQPVTGAGIERVGTVGIARLISGGRNLFLQ